MDLRIKFGWILKDGGGVRNIYVIVNTRLIFTSYYYHDCCYSY